MNSAPKKQVASDECLEQQLKPNCSVSIVLECERARESYSYTHTS